MTMLTHKLVTKKNCQVNISFCQSSYQTQEMVFMKIGIWASIRLGNYFALHIIELEKMSATEMYDHYLVNFKLVAVKAA
jgi:hypothetical protein